MSLTITKLVAFCPECNQILPVYSEHTPYDEEGDCDFLGYTCPEGHPLESESVKAS